MKRKKTFGQIVITAMFVWSALLCHLEASSLKEQGNLSDAILYWFFGLTAILGAFRFKIADFIYWILAIKNKIRK